jgi:hypothetical protein
MKSRVSTESLILVAICLVDMVCTLFFVMRGCAVEQNPLMAVCLRHGPMVFVFVKLASFMPFVVAVELYKRKDAAFARLACRSAIVLYLITFIVMTVGSSIT